MRVKPLQITMILLFMLTILLTLLISPISEWLLSLSGDYIIPFNVVVLFMWLLTCLTLFFGTKINNRKETMFLVVLFGLVFHASELLGIYAGNTIRIWHSYFSVRSIESVVVSRNIGDLPRIFDNYVSSPASPIIGGVLSIVLGLNSVTVMMFGFVYIIVIVLSLETITKTIVKEENKNERRFPLSMIIAMYFIPHSALIGHYSLASISLLSLIVFILVKITEYDKATNHTFILSRLLTLILLCYSALMYYLPLSFLMSILLLVGISASKVPDHVKRISLTLFTIASAYFIYVGFSFYDDFKTYINALTESFKPEPFIIWSENAAKRLDPVFQILLWMTRTYPLTLIFVLTGLLYAYKAKPSLRFLTLLGIVGVIGALSAKFFHILSDYTARLNVLVSLAIPLGLYYGAQLIKRTLEKINLKSTPIRVFVFLLLILMITNSISSWFFSGLLYPASPKSASDHHYYIDESFKTAIYVGNMQEWSSNVIISANWRYGYLKSIYGIKLCWEYSVIIDSYAGEQTIIIVLSDLSKDFPDYASPPLGNEKWARLHESLNVMYMSSHSRIFMRG
ncbi:MAG: hypothetical protein ACPLSM_00070 [Thermosphaera sp.]